MITNFVSQHAQSHPRLACVVLRDVFLSWPTYVTTYMERSLDSAHSPLACAVRPGTGRTLSPDYGLRTGPAYASNTAPQT